MRNRHDRGMTLFELLLGCVIIMIILALAGFQVRGLVQRAKISAAKSTINGYALCLGMVKDDALVYPSQLSELKEAAPPSGFSSKDWCGPYGMTLPLNDPWGSPYLYNLVTQQETIFGPEQYEKETPPKVVTVSFSARAGSGRLIIDNPGITSASLKLNGVEVVTESEFQQIIPVINKEVTLLAGNTMELRIRSNPSQYIQVRFIGTRAQNYNTYALRSIGRDRTQGTGDDIVYGEF